MSRVLLIYVTLLFGVPICAAQDSSDVNNAGDVKFVVLGKTTNHRQVAEGVYALLNYHFFAEIFLREGSIITDAKLTSVNDATSINIIFEDTPPVLELHGGRYTSEEALNSSYPDGEYVFSYVLNSGELVEQAITLENSSDKTRLPFPVVIYLSQAGERVNASAIDPNLDLDITWSPFESGNIDSNKISDDLVFAVTGDCHGVKVDHSGVPFGDGSYLTFASKQHTVPASKLYPGEFFQIFVEHADMDTSEHEQTPGIATYAATTFLDIKTTGVRLPERAPCPDVMPAMDGGQTDRPKPKKIDL